jgi:ribose transport system substrate-binding protein
MTTRRDLLLRSASLAILTACRRSGERVIAVIPKATSHLFFISVHAGVDRAARDFHVNVLWNGPKDETDYTRQIEIVDAMIARRVAGIVISATDEHALVSPLERAIREGIPVTVFDSAVYIDNYVSFIATDNYQAGSIAARILAGLVENRGNVAMVMQKPGGRSTVLRERAFEQTIAAEFPLIRIAARQYGMADPARSRAAAEDILTANPDLSGMFASSEAASIGCIQAIRGRDLSGKIRLVTFDFSSIHIEALKDGTADVMLCQDPVRIGYEAVKSMADTLAGRTPVKRLEIPVRVIRKADLDKPDVHALLFQES